MCCHAEDLAISRISVPYQYRSLQGHYATVLQSKSNCMNYSKKCLITSASNVSVVGQKTSKLQNTVLDLLEDGDDVMKDRGFDINVI